MWKTNRGLAARGLAALIALGAFVAPAQAEPEHGPEHGIAMYGTPALPQDFVSLPYANPDAPKGGVFISGETGSFDSLNPHIRKGRVPWQLRFLAHESLMGRSYDEPFTLYGLLAESVETDPERTWVEFTLREEARFSDGTPVTIEDVLWSYETLGTEGHPRYHGTWGKVAKAEITGARKIRFTFNVADRELALIMGLRPILKKAQWEGIDFAQSGVDVIPISSAPYVIDSFEAGRYVSLKRNPDYWGKDVPFRRGTNNIDEIRMEFFTDGTAHFEAFKAGDTDALRETDVAKWETQYAFPAVQSGEVVKSIVPHLRPTGITGFVMNTRRAPFDDWRVRDALIHAFNFEFINQTLNGRELPRISSYFANSVLAMEPGAAAGATKALLDPFAADLLPGAIEGYTLPVSDGSERNRANISRALEILAEAGWTVQEGKLADANGVPFEMEILLSQGSARNKQIADIYVETLRRIGIAAEVKQVDSAQYKERATAYDFDMTYYRRGLSLSPGNEQLLYWGGEGVEKPGTRNYMGMNVPAVDAIVDQMLNAPDQAAYRAAVRALDRILISGRYVIPIWHAPTSRIAHKAKLKFSDRLPMYGDWIGFMPDVWWIEE